MSNNSFCPVSKKCGACQLENLSYAQQLSWKQGRCVTLLNRFGHVDEIIGMENPYNYRNKIQSAFCTTRSGLIISGIYQSSTHNVVKVDSCRLEDKKADEIVLSIRKMLKGFGLTAYDENKSSGFLRHVLIRRGFATGEILVVLVTAKPDFPKKKDFISVLIEKHPEITSIVQNINGAFTSLVLGERQNVLYGNGYIEDVLCGCRFRISPKSFYQINPVQTEILYSKAMEFAGLNKSMTVLDAYCGIGTIGLVASKQAGKVYGVEINREAVKDAIANAKLNNASTARFYCADAGDFIDEMSRSGEKCDVVFMDPPRAGSSEKFLASVLRLKPSRVVYISCNPETLARDLAVLTKTRYKVVKIQPVDMFPHTSHVETVCLLSAKEK